MVLLCSVCHKKGIIILSTECIVVLCYYRGVYCLYKQHTHLSVLLIFHVQHNHCCYNTQLLVTSTINFFYNQSVQFKLQKQLDSYKFNLSIILRSHKIILLVMWIHLEEQLVLECFPLLQKQV